MVRYRSRKGKEGELELAKILEKRFGSRFKRTPGSGGMDFKGDIFNKIGLHIECKRDEHLSIWKAMEQARGDSVGTRKTPVVIFRRNNDYWKVTLSLDDFCDIYDVYLEGLEEFK